MWIKSVARELILWSLKHTPRYFAGKLRRPFFIVGSGRSGTTLLFRTLASHKEISAYPSEANELWHPQLYPWWTSKHRSSVPPIWVNAQEFTSRSLMLRSRAQTRIIRSAFGLWQFVTGGTVFLNKSAMVTLMLPYIAREFPDARYIHIIRDGRAVANSYAIKQFRTIQEHVRPFEVRGIAFPIGEVLLKCAISWRVHIEEIEKQKRENLLIKGENLYELRYERLCEDPEGELKKIAKYMGVSEDGFTGADYSKFNDMNYKYKSDLSKSEINAIMEIMKPVLAEKGYI